MADVGCMISDLLPIFLNPTSAIIHQKSLVAFEVVKRFFTFIALV